MLFTHDHHHQLFIKFLVASCINLLVAWYLHWRSRRGHWTDDACSGGLVGAVLSLAHRRSLPGIPDLAARLALGDPGMRPALDAAACTGAIGWQLESDIWQTSRAGQNDLQEHSELNDWFLSLE
jgi:hypothetical protein